MAELTSLERLQPSLLDRLSDDDTEQAIEPRDQRILSMRGLRKAVLRDLLEALAVTIEKHDISESEFWAGLSFLQNGARCFCFASTVEKHHIGRIGQARQAQKRWPIHRQATLRALAIATGCCRSWKQAQTFRQRAA